MLVAAGRWNGFWRCGPTRARAGNRRNGPRATRHGQQYRLAAPFVRLNQTYFGAPVQGVAFSGQASFGRMLASGPAGLASSEVRHKPFPEGNEEGTEAAAVTSVGIVGASVPPANRPFVFLIRKQSSGAMLFVGQVMNP